MGVKGRALCGRQVVTALALAGLLVCCASSPTRSARIEERELGRLGLWSASDTRGICAEMAAGLSQSLRFNAYIMELHRNPRLRVGEIINDSTEDVDTALLRAALGPALRAEGKVIMTDGEADCELAARVTTTVAKKNLKVVRRYYVNLELRDLATGRLLWEGYYDKLLKAIKAGPVRRFVYKRR